MSNLQDMLRPSNILVLVVFYMPLIVSVIVLSWGIVMQSVNGFHIPVVYVRNVCST